MAVCRSASCSDTVDLEQANQAIQAMEVYERDRKALGGLSRAAEHLIHAEPHHEREEEALFPELERRGVTGPPTIMRLEHKKPAQGIATMRIIDGMRAGGGPVRRA